MSALFDPTGTDDPEGTVRPGPRRRHALWVAGVTLLGLGPGWASAFFRIGPEEYGLPSAAPGPVLPYLALWAATGLVAAAALRATAARVPVHAAGRIAAGLTALGTRLSLGWRPEAPLLGAMIVAALTVAAVWCALALRSGPRAHAGGRVASGG
ncbi:hypothetical protein [Streptomyces sp. NPDC006368]|uniref:hypothetical protein n=1 Tax=Streptomyces sp. NPDC006368 TaxID=3156760 RepID=UPI0033B3F719